MILEIKRRARRAARTAGAIAFSGDNYFCPCCQRHLRRFVRGAHQSNLACPACGSLERQRLLMLYLMRETNVFSSRLRVLHFAPEQCLHDRFRTAPLLEYVTADIRKLPLVDLNLDIMALDCPDASFDLIICSHVLQDVSDDKQAMRELTRVLRADGRAFLQHPIDPHRADTFEDPSITHPRERARAFGRAEGHRRYGRDFEQRLRDAGLFFKRVDVREELDAATIERCALRDASSLRADDVYVCSLGCSRSRWF